MEKKKVREENMVAEYKRLKREIKWKIRSEKIEKECSKITEANEHRKSKEVFQQICKVKGII